MKKFQLVATEIDGIDNIRSITININARNNMSEADVLQAIQKACMDYCKTEVGRRTYEYNCGGFNYGDFEINVPNEICQKYGIEKVDEPDRIVIDNLEFDTQLVDEEELDSFYDSQDEEELE